MSPRRVVSVANELVSIVSLVPVASLLSRSQTLARLRSTGLHYTRLTVVNCARTYVSMAPR